jgi:outer membrane receptor protein involved in Fe transport
MVSGAAFASAGAGHAADSRLLLNIGPKSYADALIDLGVQANVSVLGVSTCGAGGRVTLAGRYELRDALDRILAGAPCRYTVADPRIVRIAAAPKAAPPPAESVAAPPSLVAELVVTATKRPASLQRLAAGASAVSREQLAITGSSDVGQTIAQVAGVTSTNLGPGRDKLLIRGLSDGAFTGRARSTVSTYLDETPINYNAPDPDLRLVDVDRIEVVRGPQGALYGSGAVAGVYRIVTSRPDLNTFEGGSLLEGASTKGGDMSYALEGYLSAPLIHDRLALRVVGYKDQIGGYLDDINLSEANVDRTRRNGGRLAFAFQATPEWRLDLTATAQKLRTNDAQYVTRAVGPRPARATHFRESHGNDFGHGALQIQGDLGWASLTSSTALVRHTFTSQYDASAGAKEAFGIETPELITYAESARIKMMVEDFVLRSPTGGDIQWLVGVYAAKTREETPARAAIAEATAAGGAAALYAEDRIDRRREVALYGEVNWRFAPAWTATLGGRRFHSRVRTASDISGALPTVTRSFEEGRSFEGFSPKIALQREFHNGDLAYVLISEGYRPGGFNSAGVLKPREERATFKSDKLRNYELGVKLRRFDQRLTIRASAYYDVWRDIQTDQYRPSGLSYTANVADARIRGVEGEASYDWDFGLTLQANGLVQQSSTFNVNTTFPNPNVPSAKVANKLPGVPDVSGGLLLTYERPLMGAITLRLAGETSYVGRGAISFDTGQSVQMDGYLRARLTADIGTDHWRAAVFVSNPQDASDDTFAYGNPFSFGANQQLLTPQRPRTFGARLAANF